MASKVDSLLVAFEQVINEPWTGTLATSERTMFLVYDPGEQRKIDFRLPDFETATRKAGKEWVLISLKSCFPTWMTAHDYREEYFKEPDILIDQLEFDFRNFSIQFLNQAIADSHSDERTLVVLKDVSSLFGFGRLSDILNGINPQFKGQFLVLFPGEYDKNHYRLLDARDGWNYLARPITL